MKRGISDEAMGRIANRLEGKEAAGDSSTWDKVEHVLQYMSADELVNALIMAMDHTEANENLDYIIQMHDIPMDGGEEYE